jgi:hypothetical protein
MTTKAQDKAAREGEEPVDDVPPDLLETLTDLDTQLQAAGLSLVIVIANVTKQFYGVNLTVA